MNFSQSIIIVSTAFLVACGTKSGDSFGSKPSSEGGVSISEAMKGFDTVVSRSCKLEGTVTAVCQAEGCWFRIKEGEGNELMVRTRDHSFMVPSDLSGKRVLVQGELKHDTTSVEQLRDFAKDEGKSAAEIDAIQTPEITVVFFADGVSVR